MCEQVKAVFPGVGIIACVVFTVRSRATVSDSSSVKAFSVAGSAKLSSACREKVEQFLVRFGGRLLQSGHFPDGLSSGGYLAR